MRRRTLSLLPLITGACLGLVLSACSTTDGGLKDIGSLSGGFAANADPNETNRRPDVYGGFTRPTLPTIANR